MKYVRQSWKIILSSTVEHYYSNSPFGPFYLVEFLKKIYFWFTVDCCKSTSWIYSKFCTNVLQMIIQCRKEFEPFRSINFQDFYLTILGFIYLEFAPARHALYVCMALFTVNARRASLHAFFFRRAIKKSIERGMTHVYCGERRSMRVTPAAEYLCICALPG